MSIEYHPAVEPWFRCGQPAEMPLIGEGALAGKIEAHVVMCQDCLQLLLEDAEKFGEPLRARRKEK